jgi:hypothetical protein
MEALAQLLNMRLGKIPLTAQHTSETTLLVPKTSTKSDCFNEVALINSRIISAGETAFS